jgi:hypothetical protein
MACLVLRDLDRVILSADAPFFRTSGVVGDFYGATPESLVGLAYPCQWRPREISSVARESKKGLGLQRKARACVETRWSTREFVPLASVSVMDRVARQ